MFSDELINKYFIKENENYRIIDQIKKKVTFKYLNICNAEFPIEFDLISVKNIMIYFNEEKTDLLMKKFHTALRIDGILLTTATEFQLDYNELFDIERNESVYYYKKWSTCRRNIRKTSNINYEKRTSAVFKDMPNIIYDMTDDKIITKISGVISYNIDENQFKQKLMFPLYFLSSKKIIYDFSGIKFLDNIHLRYISEILPKNAGKLNENPIIFIIGERFMPDFFHSKINNYVRIISPVDYSKEKKSAANRTDEFEKNVILLNNASETVKPKFFKVESQENNAGSNFMKESETPVLFANIASERQNLNANIQPQNITTLEKNNPKYLLLDKVYETDAQTDKFKEQLLKLVGSELSVKNIVIDAGSLEFINNICIIFLKRFVNLCKSNSINLKIINSRKNVADYLIRQEIPLEDVS